LENHLKLYIGNKNYSSWSMRPWVLMKQMDIGFDEHLVRFDGFTPESSFKKAMAELCPTGRVPVLVDSGLVIWDSLAIVEYLAERFPDRHLWPQQPDARALARSLCAEMHSGFTALRAACPMNIEASLPDIGALMLRDRPSVRDDLARIDHMWSSSLARFGGPMLFGRYTIADAFFAPVVMRIKTYHLPLSELARDYVQACLGTSGVEAWVDEAIAENDFRDFEEPYRLKPSSEIKPSRTN
jgi:glutathione S-transferase